MRRATLVPLLLLIAGCKDPVVDETGDFVPGAAQLLSVGSPTKDEDPSVLLARDGRVFVAWFSDRGGNADIYVTSTADGATWTSPVRVTTNAGGDFNPSLIQDDQGTFHLAWFRWQALNLGNIWYSSSTDGVTWTPEVQATKTPQVDDWVPTLTMAPDGTVLIYFVSQRRSGNSTSDLYLATRRPGAAEFDAAVPLTMLNSATEHDHLPFAARTSQGISLVWVRHDTSKSLPWENKKSDLYYATSSNGTAWSAPLEVTNDTGEVVNLFPAFYENAPGQWSLNWLSGRSGDPKVFELGLSDLARYPTGIVQDKAFPNGYSQKIARTPKAGVYLGAWVQGAEGAQDIWYRIFKK